MSICIEYRCLLVARFTPHAQLAVRPAQLSANRRDVGCPGRNQRDENTNAVFFEALEVLDYGN